MKVTKEKAELFIALFWGIGSTSIHVTSTFIMKMSSLSFHVSGLQLLDKPLLKNFVNELVKNVPLILLGILFNTTSR